MTSRPVWILCLVAVLVSQVACSRTFYMRPVGRLSEGITFQFFDKLSDTRQTSVRLTSFSVDRHIGPNQWVTVWEIRGKGHAESVAYGRPVDGFRDAPVEALDKDGQYRASATALFSSAIGYSSVFFAFNQDGSVRMTEAVLK